MKGVDGGQWIDRTGSPAKIVEGVAPAKYSTGVTAPRVSTKDRIVDASVALFNESGVGPVTTNHIAAHLGMSPGNLYYHFTNKEEIIRAAFVRMNAEAEAIWSGDLKDNTLLQRIVVANLELYTRYLFFARELPALLRADEELAKSYRAIAEVRMEQLEGVLMPLAKAGMLKDLGDREDVRALAESAWMIGLFCVPYSETLDAGTPAPRTAKGRTERTNAALERGALMVLGLFRPYMDVLAYTALVVVVRSQLESAMARQ